MLHVKQMQENRVHFHPRVRYLHDLCASSVNPQVGDVPQPYNDYELIPEELAADCTP